MIDKEEIEYSLTWAQAFFKFGYASPDSFANLQFLEIFAYGRHTVGRSELELTKKQQEYMPTILQYIATYILATQMDTALEKLLGTDRFKDQNESIRNAAIIVRMLRNSFTHNPFDPKWLIEQKHRNRELDVNNIITFNTNGLNGTSITRDHYGGPLCLLQLSQYLLEYVRAHT